MSPAFVALSIVALAIVATILLALANVRRISLDPAEYIVGGRTFGALFLWILLGGEVYTSFTFLGAAGWAYGLGAPAYYIPAYGTCGFIIGYFLLPAIWRVGKERNLLTIGDFFASMYGSRPLGSVVAVIASVMAIPYVTLQLTGLQKILTIAGYGAFDAKAAVAVAFLAIALFVFSAGLRGTAWASVVKDALMIGAIIFAGILLPLHFFGSPAAMFDRIVAAHPERLILAGPTAPKGSLWYVSTVLLTSIGFFMGSHSFSAVYSARSGDALRRNAVAMPVYQVLILLVFFAGFSASVVVPGLKDTDLSFLALVQRYYAPTLLGAVCAAGALAALVPASAILLGASASLTKNVLGDVFGIATSDVARTSATRITVLLIAVLALILWFFYNDTLVSLLLLVYSGITQFAPGAIAAFLWPRATTAGVWTGLIGGLIAAAIFTYGNLPTFGVNPGFVALVFNVVLLIGVSLAKPRVTSSQAGA